MITQSYLSFAVSVYMSFYIISWSGTDISLINNFAAIVGLAFLGYIPVLSFNTIFKTTNLKDEEFQERYKIIINDLRTDSPFRYQYITVFYFRRAIYAGAFVLLEAWPILQVTVVNLSAFLMLLYLVIFKPYESTLSRILSVINEVLLFTLLMFTIKFINPKVKPKESNIYGNFMIAFVLITVVINWTFIAIFGALNTYKKYTIKKLLKKIPEEQKKKFEELEETPKLPLTPRRQHKYTLSSNCESETLYNTKTSFGIKTSVLSPKQLSSPRAKLSRSRNKKSLFAPKPEKQL